MPPPALCGCPSQDSAGARHKRLPYPDLRREWPPDWCRS